MGKINLKNLSKKIVSEIAAFAILFQSAFPVYGNNPVIKVDGSVAPNHQSTLDVAPNGVTIVQIVPPNSSGTSHNKFTEFNVPVKGVILNNSQTYGCSELGGHILGNANLQKTGSAKLILNEVTGRNRSLLEGHTEIFGQKADYILANPNGITVNGGGFINTPRATLTTGVPEFDPAHGLTKLSVSQGIIRIDGAGVDVQELDHFDIIARSVKINGIIHGRKTDEEGNVIKTTDVGIHSGVQTYDYQSRTSEERTNIVPKKQKWGIDSSALGGIYAGRITLVGNEKGVGVKTPANMASSVDDITVTADGDIILKNMETARDLKVTSHSGTSRLSSDSRVVLGRDGILSSGKRTVVDKGAVVNIGGTLTSSAKSFINRGTLQGGQSIISTSQEFSNEGKIAQASLHTNAAGDLQNTGDILLQQKATLQSGKEFKNKGTGCIEATEGLEIHARSVLNTDEGRLKSGDGKVVIASETTFENAENALISGVKGVEIESKTSASNAGKIESNGLVTVNGQTFENEVTGKITGAQLGMGTVAAFTNKGFMSGQEAFYVKAGRTLTNTSTGILNSGGELELEANSIKNYGVIQSKTPLVLKADTTIENDAGFIFSGDTTLMEAGQKISNINGGRILSFGKATFQGLNGAKADVLENISSSIETLVGDAVVKMRLFDNKRRALTVTPIVTRGTSGKKDLTITTDTITADSPEAKFLSGGNIFFDVDTINNEYSTIAAGNDIDPRNTRIINTSKDLIKTTLATWSRVVCEGVYKWGVRVGSRRYTVQERDPLIVEKIGRVTATIQAGGALKGNLTGLSNGDNVVQNQPYASGTQAANDVPHPAVESTFRLGASTTLDLDNHLVPNAGVQVYPGLERDYLVESRAIHVLPHLWMGSEYFLSRMDPFKKHNPKKRFGDSFIERDIIREQIHKLTAHHILPGFNSEDEQVKALYDNALKESSKLELTPYATLSEDQVSRLSKDILWLETQTVRGEEVLVPKLYLSKLTRENLDTHSGHIIAKDIDVKTLHVHNSGAIQGLNSLQIDSEQDIDNTGGSLKGKTVDLKSQGNFLNVSGTVDGEDVDVFARNILNERRKVRDYTLTGYMDRLEDPSQIKASKTLKLRATENVMGRAGLLHAGTHLDVEAGKRIDLGSQAVQSDSVVNLKHYYERESHLTHSKSIATSGGTMSFTSGEGASYIGFEGTAKGLIKVKSGGELDIQNVLDEHFSEKRITSNGGWFGGKSSETHKSMTQTVDRSVFQSEGSDVLLTSHDDMKLKASDVKANGKVRLESETGKIHLQGDKSSKFEQHTESGSNMVWQHQSDEGSHHETLEMPHLKGDVEFVTSQGVEVDVKSGSSVDVLAQQPGLEWLGDLKNRTDVKWNRINEAHEHWDYSSQGLTSGAAAVLSLAIGVATYGAGTGISAGISAGVGGGAMGATMGAMGSAAFSTLVSRASISLINNGGDLGKVMQDLGSRESLRSLATVIISAGIVSGVTSGLGISTVPDSSQATTFMEKTVTHLQHNLVRSGVSSVVSSGLEGTNLGENLVDGLKSAAVNSVASATANTIGEAYDDGKGDLSYGVHKGLHFGLGAGAGLALGGDLESAVSGGVGGVVGEIVGEEMKHSIQKDVDDKKITTQDEIDDRKQHTINVSKLVSGSSAFLLNKNVTLASNAGENAVENNSFITRINPQILATLGGLIGIGLVEQKINGETRAKQIDELSDKIRDYCKTEGSSNSMDMASENSRSKDQGFAPHESGTSIFSTPIHDNSGRSIFSTPIYDGGYLPIYTPIPNDLPNTMVLESKIYIGYHKMNRKTGQVYTGRTSGEGEINSERDLDKIVRNRDRNHHMNKLGFGPAIFQEASLIPQPIRGWEQSSIDQNGGAQSKGGTSGNSINGISDTNPRKTEYEKAAQKEFGGK